MPCHASERRIKDWRKDREREVVSQGPSVRSSALVHDLNQLRSGNRGGIMLLFPCASRHGQLKLPEE